MQHAVGAHSTERADLPARVVVHPTQLRSRSQRWIGWAVAAVCFGAAGIVTGVPLLAVLGLVCAAVTARHGVRLLRSLRRLDDVGLTRWSANVVMTLLPPEDVRRHRSLAHVPVPDGVEHTPEAVLRHVLADETRHPTVAPWARDDPDAPRAGSSGPARAAWLAPVGAVVGWLVTAAAVLSIDVGRTTRAAALVLALLPVAAATWVVARHRVTIHDDGRLEIRRLTGTRTLHLLHLLQASGWTWSIDADAPSGGRPKLHAATLSLVFGDGSHVALHPRNLRDDGIVAQALRHWVTEQRAVVTPDLAYALGFTDDPREADGASLARDDRWMRRPGRRLRTTAVHAGAATTVLQPGLVAVATVLLLG